MAIELQTQTPTRALRPGHNQVTPPTGQLIGQLAGSYQLTQLLGTGGSGEVYLAEHPVIGTRVAVKVLHAEVAATDTMLDRFIQEARTASRVGSEHIPRYFDFGHLDNGQPYATLEYYEGETLYTRIERVKSPPAAETIHVLAQVAAAMVDAHANNIVHRDIKPANIFLESVEDHFRVKLLDFGIAKLVHGGGGGGTNQTSAGLILGTPQYCAPEQALGDSVGPAADVYALGATAYHCFTGTPPFEGDAVTIVTTKVHEDAAPILSRNPNVPPPVATLVDAMLTRIPGSRPSMVEVRDTLYNWLAPPANRSAQIFPTEQLLLAPESSQRRRGFMTIVVAALITLALGVVALIVFAPSDAEQRSTPAGVASDSPPTTKPMLAAPPAEVDRTPPQQDPRPNGDVPALSTEHQTGGVSAPPTAVQTAESPQADKPANKKSKRRPKSRRRPERTSKPSSRSKKRTPTSPDNGGPVIVDPF